MIPHTLFRCFLVTSWCLLLSACSSFPKDDIVFKSASAPDINWDKFKTFTWLAEADIVNDPQGYMKVPSFDVSAELQFALSSELRDKHYIESKSNPDFAVIYTTGIDMEALEMDASNTDTKPLAKNVPKAGLSVIFMDMHSRKPIWIGAAMADFHQEFATEVAIQRLHYAVESILDTVPDAK